MSKGHTIINTKITPKIKGIHSGGGCGNGNVAVDVQIYFIYVKKYSNSCSQKEEKIYSNCK